MLGFTGLYKGRRISVQAAAWDPLHRIYSYELYHVYGWDALCIGSAGGIAEDVEVGI
jgi:purine-nucleoside phosphorylase